MPASFLASGHLEADLPVQPLPSSLSDRCLRENLVERRRAILAGENNTKAPGASWPPDPNKDYIDLNLHLFLAQGPTCETADPPNHPLCHCLPQLLPRGSPHLPNPFMILSVVPFVTWTLQQNSWSLARISMTRTAPHGAFTSLHAEEMHQLLRVRGARGINKAFEPPRTGFQSGFHSLPAV